jgi:hypothetical protein
LLRRFGLVVAAVTLLLPLELAAQKSAPPSASHSPSSRSKSSSKTTSSKPKSTIPKPPKKSTVAQRTPNGKIRRSAAARTEFMKQTGYPKGRQGYVVDHIVPLECGGADVPSNMQWQTLQEARIKDRTERNCRR